MNRFASPAWLALLLLAPAAHAGNSLALPDVLSRYRAAIGPKPADTPQRITGTEETGGLKGTYVTVEQGRRFWTETKLGIADYLDGSDGSVFWHRDSNGSTHLLSSEELREQRTDDAVDHDEFASPDTFKGKVTLRPQTEKRTGDYILDVLPDGGKPVTLYLDPTSFLLARMERDEDDFPLITTYSGYREMAGQMQPTVIRTHTGGSKNKYDDTITVDAVNDIASPAPTLFAVPASVKNYTWTTPGATSATLPFDDGDNGIALYVVINGHPTYLEVDSGAGGLAIVKVAADRLGLRPQGVFQGYGYGGTVEDAPVMLDTLELVGGVIFHNVTASSLAVERGYANYQAVNTIGLMGYSLLSRFVVKIDYPAGLLTLSDPDTWTPTPADGMALPLELTDNVPSVLASLDGLPPARFLVDTGDAVSTVHLYGPYVRANGLSAKYPKGMDVFGKGVGGIDKARRVRAHTFTLAGVTLKDVPTDLSLDTQGMGASHTLAGALGHDFLSRFTVTFDYPHGRLFLAPNHDTLRPFDTRTFGISVMELPDDDQPNVMQKIIVHVDEHAPAARAGISAGQILEKVDGHDVSALSLGAVRRMLSGDGGSDTRILTVTTHGVGVVNSQLSGTSNAKVSLYDPLPPAGEHK